jgi:hypothetical protein
MKYMTADAQAKAGDLLVIKRKIGQVSVLGFGRGRPDKSSLPALPSTGVENVAGADAA